MILMLIFVALFVLCFLWKIGDSTYDWNTDLGAEICVWVSGAILVITIIWMLAGRSITISDVRKFEAIRETVSEQRQNPELTQYERATLTQKIIEENEWLAGEKYWAKSKWLNWYYDKIILDVEPIK